MEGGCEYIGINTLLSGSLPPRHGPSPVSGWRRRLPHMESSYEGIGINITLRGSVVTIAMTQPQVVDGGVGLIMWRVAVNMPNNYS
jgi:hypothetical protein